MDSSNFILGNITLRPFDTCLNIEIDNDEEVSKKRVSSWVLVAIILGYGVIIALLGWAVKNYRRAVYKEIETVDTAFTGGGQMNAGLVMTNLVSQWTWAATLLQSSGVGIKYGISGNLWYAGGACIQMLLFSVVSVMLKIRAPGAITFLQVIRARFGRRAHITFCVFALLTNTIVTAMLMIGGCAVMTQLSSGISVEMCTILIVFVIGVSTMTGGLTSAYYISYFTTITLLLSVLVFTVTFFNIDQNEGTFNSLQEIYRMLKCRKAIESNYNQAYLTLLSKDGLMFGVINIIGNFGTVFVDQSYWQASVASKPREGVIGFLSGGLVWFAIPFTFSTTCSLFYLSTGVKHGTDLLTEAEVDNGVVPKIIATFLFGESGQVALIIMVVIAVATTAVSEVLAVTSILVYDIYAVYIKPFRRTFDSNSCILCGKMRGRMARLKDKCKCISMTSCGQCIADDRERQDKKQSMRPIYKCTMHGTYRSYLDYIGDLKSWCMIFVILGIVPLTLFLYAIQVNLSWLYQFMGVVIGSAIAPVCYTMLWSRLTGDSIVLGATVGGGLAILSWLIYAGVTSNGLSLFLKNTGRVDVMLVGNCVSIFMGITLPVVLTFIFTRNKPQPSDDSIWENTRDIDNPLRPWPELYVDELNLKNAEELSDGRPALSDVLAVYRKWQLIAIFVSIILTCTFVVFWPGIAAAVTEFTEDNFKAWIYFMEVYLALALTFAIVYPLVSEVKKCLRTLAKNQVGPRQSVQPHPVIPVLESQPSAAVSKRHLYFEKPTTLCENVTENTPVKSQENLGSSLTLIE